MADRGFDDRKVFGQVLALGEEFVVRVYRDRKLGEGGSLAKVASSLALPCGEEVELRLGGRYQRVRLHFGWREVEVEGRRLHLVVCRVPALGRRGEWWLLTSLPVRGREEAARVVEAYRRRWEVERFFRLLKRGLGLETFQVRGLARIRKVVAVLLGLAVFACRQEFSPHLPPPCPGLFPGGEVSAGLRSSNLFPATRCALAPRHPWTCLPHLPHCARKARATSSLCMSWAAKERAWLLPLPQVLLAKPVHLPPPSGERATPQHPLHTPLQEVGSQGPPPPPHPRLARVSGAGAPAPAWGHITRTRLACTPEAAVVPRLPGRVGQGGAPPPPCPPPPPPPSRVPGGRTLTRLRIRAHAGDPCPEEGPRGSAPLELWRRPPPPVRLRPRFQGQEGPKDLIQHGSFSPRMPISDEGRTSLSRPPCEARSKGIRARCTLPASPSPSASRPGLRLPACS